MDRIEKDLARFRHELDEKFAEMKGVLDNLLDKLEFEFRAIYAEQEQTERWKAAMDARVEALEKRNPPAA